MSGTSTQQREQYRKVNTQNQFNTILPNDKVFRREKTMEKHCHMEISMATHLIRDNNFGVGGKGGGEGSGM